MLANNAFCNALNKIKAFVNDANDFRIPLDDPHIRESSNDSH